MSRVTLPHTRFTVDEFIRLVEADAFGTTRVELLNERMHFFGPQSTRHMAAVSTGAERLFAASSRDEWVVIGGTLHLDRYSATDPDLMWLPCPKGTPMRRWPDPVVLLEISDTTYRKDSGTKLRKYAYHGIPDYWIENLRLDRIEVYRDPVNPTGRERGCFYASVEHFGRGQSIPVPARPGVTLAVDDLLP